MTINVSPAARELTSLSRVLNRDGERAQIRRGKAEYFKRGGLIGVYAAGMPWDMPSHAEQRTRDHGRDKVSRGDVSEYLSALKERIESGKLRREMAMKRAKAERENRAGEWTEEQSEMAMMHGDDAVKN